MYKLILVRHGESVWNKENRFTGWTDVDLSERGEEEARRAGELIKKHALFFDVAYSSVLKRAYAAYFGRSCRSGVGTRSSSLAFERATLRGITGIK